MSNQATWWRALVLLTGAGILVLSVMAVSASSSPADPEDVPRIKAAIVYRILKFVEWPARSLPADGTILLGLLGTDEDEPAFETVEGLMVGRMPLEIRRIERLKDVVQCQAIFVARSEAPLLSNYLDVLGGLPILTISEIDRFGDVGGMLQIQETGSKIGFRVNLEITQDSDLVLSSQLLKIAEIVERVD